MGEADRHFFDDLTLTDRPRDASHLQIWREKLANEMIAITPSRPTPPAIVSCVQITGELGIHMLLKQIDHRLRRHDISPPARTELPGATINCRRRMPHPRFEKGIVAGPASRQEVVSWG
jgi:hypothetical protein